MSDFFVFHVRNGFGEDKWHNMFRETAPDGESPRPALTGYNRCKHSLADVSRLLRRGLDAELTAQHVLQNGSRRASRHVHQ